MSSRHRSRPRAPESPAWPPVPFGTETASSTTPAMSRPSASWISVRRRESSSCDALRESTATNERAHELDRAAGGLSPLPSKTISGRTRNGASRSAGSLTVQPSPGRWRRLAPQRARRRSGGVVVRRLVALGWRLAHDRPDEPVDARHLEVRRRGELQLAFGAVLHGRLSVAPCDSPAAAGVALCRPANARRAALGTESRGRSAKL